MAVTSTIIAGVSAAAAVGGTTYAAVNANQQRIRGERAASDAKTQQDQAIADAKKQQDLQVAQQAQTALNAQTRRRQDPSSAAGTGGTILTSPLGLLGGSSPAGGKTLLGA